MSPAFAGLGCFDLYPQLAVGYSMPPATLARHPLSGCRRDRRQGCLRHGASQMDGVASGAGILSLPAGSRLSRNVED
jgi:hypothetical protein